MTSPMDIPPTPLVAGKYQLTRMLGRGGMGSVWEGIHTSLGTRVAVKFIESEYADSREARSRFENEARAAATLRSKHVVQVFDHGVMEDGRPWIVMEFLAGEPLDRRLDRVGRLSAAETGRVIQQVCRALSKAHDAGIVHRDLKPENVFLVWDEEDGADIVKVVDFGIAKFSNNSLGVSSSTRTGSVLGTPYYMSPEQARGLRSVDFRSDLWSVAVISYRCLVGTLPFDGEAVGDLLVKICTAPLPVPSQSGAPVPPGYDEWFARALQRDPAQRYATAAELADTLCQVCGLAPRSKLGSATGERSQLPGVPATVRAATGGGVPTPPTMRMDSVFTPSPMTHTSETVSRPSRGGVIAAAVMGLVVLAVGAGVVIKLVAGGSDETAATSSAEIPKPAIPAAAPPMPVAPVVEPAPPPPTAAEPEASSKPATAAAPTSTAPRKRSTSKPSVAAVKPATKPPKPETKPRPTTTGSRPGNIDVGY